MLAVPVPLGISASRATAQDAQYWALAYGTESRLLGGTVIGNDREISGVYYNPGALKLEKAQVLISLNALQYSSLSFSTRAGAGHAFGGTELMASAEWFAAVPKFTIVPGVPLVPQTGGAPIPVAFTAQHRALINWGIGARQHLSDHLDAFLAYRTDLTSTPPGVIPVGTLINWDLMHINLGVQGQIGPAALTLGTDTSWGSESRATMVGAAVPGLTLPPLSERYVNIVGAIAFRYAF